MTTSKYRGYDIHFIYDYWIYSGTKQKVSKNVNRTCGHYGKPQTENGHDGCIGTIDGVMNACCGHGVENEAYIQFLSGDCIRGEMALEIIDKIRGKSNEHKLYCRKVI